MEWRSSVVMGSGAVFTRVYSLIQQITRKSKFSLDCCRSIKGLVRPRIIIAGIRNLGLCPCPRCLIPMDHVPNMGMRRDLSQRVSLARVDNVRRRSHLEAARKAIYKHNNTVDGAAIERLLKDDSLVPTAVSVPFLYAVDVDVHLFQNAFSEKLSPLEFNMFSMLVVDLLHEFEIGVWKAVFIHLLRLLDCLNEKLKHDLDRR